MLLMTSTPYGQIIKYLPPLGHYYEIRTYFEMFVVLWLG
jgi:hypothetical protein